MSKQIDWAKALRAAKRQEHQEALQWFYKKFGKYHIIVGANGRCKCGVYGKRNAAKFCADFLLKDIQAIINLLK